MKIRKLAFIFVYFLSFVWAHGQEQMSRAITCRVGHYETVQSKILNEERTMLVHLPEDYKFSLKKYPVLYVLDGEGTHRFIQTVAAITFYSGARRLPKMIVVGIINTDRTRDITPRKVMQRKNSGGGDAFLEFIISELNPYIEKMYRSAPYRILFGGSSAGMFTIYTLFNRPESFNAYIASRPALNSTDDYTWDSGVIFQKARELLAERSSLKKALYIDYGGQEDALHDPAPIQKLSAIFKSEAPQDFRWEIQKMNESGYRSAESLKTGLLAVFKDWYFPSDSLLIQGIEGGKAHSEKLSKQFGYSIGLEDMLDETDLIQFGYRFLEKNRIKEAIALFKYAVEVYAGSWSARDSLAEAYMEEGQKELAIQNYQKSLELNPKNTNAVRMLEKLQKKRTEIN